MKRTMGGWLSCGVGLLALVLSARPAQSAGLEDFKLIKAIPADAMIVVDKRDHAGREFIDRQFQRVWEAVEKQNFDRDIKRLIRSAFEGEGEEADKFDTQWQQINDLAARVTWSKLGQREHAFAMSLVPPAGVDFVVLLMPPADQVAQDFDGLTAILKNLVGLAPQGELVLSSEGEGESVVHKLSVPNPMTPISFTLARQKDVLLIGMGPAMVEQALALLRGTSDAATASIASSERFQQAFKRLPPPADAVHYVDLARVVAQARAFAKMGAEEAAKGLAPAESETAPSNPLEFLPKIIDQVDLWEYAAGVETTEGMRTNEDTLVALREEGRTLPLYKALYGNGPLKDPLKYIPKEATGVTVTSGIDLAALYKAIVDFVDRNVPQGKELLEQWKQKQEEIGFNIENDALSWLGGGFAKFSAPRGSAYVQDWAMILEVRDEAKGNEMLDKLATKLNDYLVPQNGGVEDAKLEAAPGFKRVILPAFLALLPIGRPVFGIKDGHLFLASSPEIVTTTLEVGAGKLENFSKSERFIQEGLPLGKDVTAVSFEDLSRRGEELGQMLGMVGLAQAFMPPEVQKHPAIVTVLSMLTKLGRVVRTLDFYKSECSVSTFDGKATTTKSVINYQEPPKPKPTTQEAEEPAKPEAKTEPRP